MTSVKIIVAALLNYSWNEVITHIPLHFIRKFFLRLFNKHISKTAVILLHVRILNFWNVAIGERSVVNQYAVLDCRRYRVIIHHDVDIGPYTRIWTLGHIPDSAVHDVVGKDVEIADHVWVASDVTILPGTYIGRGAIIAASSVVTKSVPCMEIWGGSPARFIRYRNNQLSYSLAYIPYFE